MPKRLRKKTRHQQPRSCVGCAVDFQIDDLGWARLKRGWTCKSCREAAASSRRQTAASTLLGKAKVTTIERDGRTFTVKTLPAKRRSG